MNERIYLSPPHIGRKEKALISDALDSNWIAPLGPQVDSFEKEMSDYLRVGHACALSSGTAALHLSLVISDVCRGDIVLCPSLTFAASANAILYQGATPVFIDVDPNTWTLNIDLLQKAIKIFSPKALIAVDIYGQPLDYDTIIDICNKNNVIVIEDAAESLGSEYKGSKCGAFGQMGVLSFNGNKIITTSGGGMLVSDDKDKIDKARFLSTQSREKALHYEHIELGYNYRMSNVLAALGRAQLEKIDNRVKLRRNIFQKYYNAFSEIDGIKFLKDGESCKSNRWLSTFTIDLSKINTTVIEIIHALEQENIESRPVWKPMHLQPLYSDCEYISTEYDISKTLFETGICLPSGSSLKSSEQEKIIDIIISKLSLK